MAIETPQCVGCGYCCIQATCFLGAQVNNAWDGRCPSLVWSEPDQRYWCKLARDWPEGTAMLFIGAGCCSNLNSWRKEVKERHEN